MDRWNEAGRYMNGRDLAEAGVAELVDVFDPPWQQQRRAGRKRPKGARR